MNVLSPDFESKQGLSVRSRVAVLVDGENISAAFASQVILNASGYGDLIIKRVYGNAQKPSAWDSAPGFKAIHSGIGKNATDLLLSVEAMALMLGGHADVLVIVTSDRDYTHLVAHLCADGHRVIGLGEAKAPATFRKSCSRFVELALPNPIAPVSVDKIDTFPLAKLALIDAQILELIAKDGDKTGLPIARLGMMHGLYKVKVSQTPEKTWRAYLLARPGLFMCDPRGPTAKVRAVPTKPAPHSAP